jgi:ferredoxin
MRILVVDGKCIACGQCVWIAPSVFDQRDDGVVKLIKSVPTEREEAAVTQAIEICPSQAISIETSSVT